MCENEGGLPQFKIPPDVSNTMEQMLQALMGRVPRGTGNGGVGGAGSGSGGSGGDGFSVAGQSTNVPMYGPDRLTFSQAGGAAGRDGSSRPTKLPEDSEQQRNQINPEKQRTPESAKIRTEKVPDKYRDAVNRYFSDGDTPPTP